MADTAVAQGFYSLLRWRVDPTRDEARNVAVMLVDAQGEFGAIRHAPISTISPRLRDQGILDELLLGLEQRFRSGGRLRDLEELQESLQRSLVVTEPQPVAVTDPEETLTALYRAYLAPRGGRSRAPTKGVVLDDVVAALRRQKVKARRGAYVRDFIFDVVIDQTRVRPASVLEVLSFAAPRKDWTPVERDAGHFLYALGRLEIAGKAVVQPPAAGNGAAQSYDRVRRWLEDEKVPIVEPEQLVEKQLVLELAQA
jgi:hypothetical protein